MCWTNKNMRIEMYKDKGKLSLKAGTPLYVLCHNDPKKKYCDDCQMCSNPQCDKSNCDAHGNCQCERTDCWCLGRP